MEGQRGTIAEQFENTRKSLDGIVYCLKQGYGVVITHGNGPQVGNLLLMVEASRNQVPELPLGCLCSRYRGCDWVYDSAVFNQPFAKRGA